MKVLLHNTRCWAHLHLADVVQFQILNHAFHGRLDPSLLRFCHAEVNSPEPGRRTEQNRTGPQQSRVAWNSDRTLLYTTELNRHASQERELIESEFPNLYKVTNAQKR